MSKTTQQVWRCMTATGCLPFYVGGVTWPQPVLIHVPEPPKCPWCGKAVTENRYRCRTCDHDYHKGCGYRTDQLSICKECLFDQAYMEEAS